MIDSPSEAVASTAETGLCAEAAYIGEEPAIPKWLKYALALRFVFLGLQASILLFLSISWVLRDLGFR